MNTLHDRVAWFQGGSSRCLTLPSLPLHPQRLILMGAPGVGKSTQAELLCRRLGACHLATGDIFRAARGLTHQQLTPELETSLGYMRRGQLVPDELVLDIVRHRRNCLQCPAGFVLDGFPRTVPQAQALQTMLEEGGLSLSGVIHYELPLDQIIARLGGRRACSKCKALFHLTTLRPRVAGVCDRCGGDLYLREDDNPESIRERILAYENGILPLLDFYQKQKLLLTVESTTPEETRLITLSALKAHTSS